MQTRTLPFFDLAHLSTSDPDGFDNAGGWQFSAGYSTVTLSEGSTYRLLQVRDDDPTFDDDDPSQVLDGAQTIGGQQIADGTVLESEYEIALQGDDGADYLLQIVSLDGDAHSARGFVIQGVMPPLAEPLTVIRTFDGTGGRHSYVTAAQPSCFLAGTIISTDRGPRPVERLRAGDRLLLAKHGASVSLRLILETQVTATAHGPPIRIKSGALGSGMPKRPLLISPQHRVYVPRLAGLVAARSLLSLPGVSPARGRTHLHYVHLVLERHGLLLANGVACESFWPGPVAMAGLPPTLRGRIRRIMGPCPVPASPFLEPADVRRWLRLR